MNADPGEVALQDAEVVDVGRVVFTQVTALHLEELPGKKCANGYVHQEQRPMSHEKQKKNDGKLEPELRDVPLQKGFRYYLSALILMHINNAHAVTLRTKLSLAQHSWAFR